MNLSVTILPNFIRKYYLLHELLIIKYWRQNISLSNIALHTAVRHSSVQKWHNERKEEYVRQCIIKHQISSLQLCGQLTVLTLTPSTTRFGGSCRSVCTAARFVTLTSWSHAWSRRVGTFPPGDHRWSGHSDSGDHVFELAFEHTVDILNTDFRCADILPFARMHTWQSITPVPIVDTYAFELPY